MLFGLAFAWITTIGCQETLPAPNRGLRQNQLDLGPNHKIRHAVEAIAPVAYPGHQQAIRVIREEVDRIEWALADIMPR